MEAIITDLDLNSNWIDGEIGDYEFQAKVFDAGSEYGINKGRISKLAIWDFKKLLIISYDREWDIKPKEEYIEIFNSVVEVLEKSPKRFSE